MENKEQEKKSGFSVESIQNNEYSMTKDTYPTTSIDISFKKTKFRVIHSVLQIVQLVMKQLEVIHEFISQSSTPFNLFQVFGALAIYFAGDKYRLDSFIVYFIAISCLVTFIWLLISCLCIRKVSNRAVNTFFFKFRI